MLNENILFDKNYIWAKNNDLQKLNNYNYCKFYL